MINPTKPSHTYHSLTAEKKVEDHCRLELAAEKEISLINIYGVTERPDSVQNQKSREEMDFTYTAEQNHLQIKAKDMVIDDGMKAFAEIELLRIGFVSGLQFTQ